jgi:hypothetical protein
MMDVMDVMCIVVCVRCEPFHRAVERRRGGVSTGDGCLPEMYVRNGYGLHR